MYGKLRRITALMLTLMLLLQNAPLTAFAEAGDALWETAADVEETDADNGTGHADAPVYDEAVAEGIDFSTKRLLVGTGDTAIFTQESEVLSVYDGVYLLGFESEAEARTAYTYYYHTAEFVEADIALFVADSSYAAGGGTVHTDALSRLAALDVENGTAQYAAAALIDTGASGENVTSVSVLGENGLDDNGHGTAMLEAIRDIAPECRVLSVKAFDSHGVGSLSTVYAAMLYAISQRVRVIDLSFAAECTADSTLLNRCAAMAQSAGIAVVGAAGNNNADAANYLPGRTEGVYIVGACDSEGVRLPVSNYGKNVFCNVAASSTSEAAARLTALIAAYGTEYLASAMDNGILFRCNDAAPEEENALPEDAQQSLLDESELTEQTLSLIRNGFSPRAQDGEDAVSGDNVTIEYINVRWNTKSTGSDTAAGRDLLVLAPDSETVPTQQFQIDFALSGQEAYAPGTIEIAFPASIWEDRYGEEAGTLTLSVPEDPETGAEFAWKRDGDMIIITNIKTLPAASKYMIQGSFRGLSAPDIKDETVSSEFQASITVVTPKNQEHLTKDSNVIKAQIMTDVEVNYAFKTAKDSMTGSYDLWWYDIPDDLPQAFIEKLGGEEEAQKYGFIRWYVAGGAGGSQPFKMYVKDTIQLGEDGNPLYGGVMLGITNCAAAPPATGEENGTVYQLSEDEVSIEALLFSGYDTKPKTAYIWTAYPRETFPDDKENPVTTIENTQEITVQGWDEETVTKKEASAEVKTRKPIQYTFIKYWDDNHDENERRPGSMLLKIYCEEYSGTEEWEKIRLTAAYAEEGDDDRWIYRWSDEGQGYHFWVREELNNASGVLEDQYEDKHFQRKWSYYLENWPDGTYDEASHTWTFQNTYNEGWESVAITAITKTTNSKFRDTELISKADSLSLNQLRQGKTVEVPYDIAATVSAANWHIANKKSMAQFILEDGTYTLDDDPMTVDDISIGTVTFKAMPKAFRYGDKKEKGYESIEIDEPLSVQVYGKVTSGENGSNTENWVLMATLTDGELTAAEGVEGVTVKGLSVTLPDGVERVKLQMEADAAYVSYSCTIALRLHPSEKMLEHIGDSFEESDYIRSVLYNKAFAYAKNEAGETHDKKESFAYAYLHGRTYKTAVELNKSFTTDEKADNDNVKQRLRLHTSLELIQQSNVFSEEDYIEAAEAKELPNTRGGTFYDLLPRGVDPDLSSIELTEGDTLVNAWVIPNYKDSGRTMLVVQVSFTDHLTYAEPYDDREHGNGYTSEAHPGDEHYPVEGVRNTHLLDFDSYISWSMVLDKSVELTNMHNIAAYEAQEDVLGSVQEWSGDFGNDLTGIKNKSSAGQFVGDELELMTDLGAGNANPSFAFAGGSLDEVVIDSYAQTEIKKEVQTVTNALWSDGRDNSMNVPEGGLYSYRLVAASADDTTTSDIVMLDSLENYKPTVFDEDDYGDTQWKGTLLSIDLTSVRAMGIAPVLYYSTATDAASLNITGYSDEKSNGDMLIDKLEHDNKWQKWDEANPPKLEAITMLAFDLRKKVNGENFELGKGETLTITLNFRAPYDKVKDGEFPAYFNDTNGLDHTKNAHAYNRLFMACMQKTNGEAVNAYINFSYTKVGIFTKCVDVEKVWNDDDDRDGLRPGSIRVTLTGSDGSHQEINLAADDDPEKNWKGTFQRIRTYDDYGNLITYTYTEAFLDKTEYSDKYTPSVSREFLPDGTLKLMLTNTHEPEKISIPVTKYWDDNDTPGFRPNEVVFRLFADETFTGQTLTLRADNEGNWFGTFTNLNKYRDHGVEIEYTIEEQPVDNYVQDKENSGQDPDGGWHFTNHYQPYGYLRVHKTVLNGTSATEGQTFTFSLRLKVTVKNAAGETEEFPVTGQFSYVICEYESTEDGNGGTIQTEKQVGSGKIGDGGEFELEDGQWIEIQELPVGVLYEVTEASRAGYECTGRVGDTGKIISWTPSEAEFTNTYTTRGYAPLSAEKVLNGRKLNAYQFRFELYETDEEWTEISLIRNGYNDSSGGISFGRIGYTNEDHLTTHFYCIKEYNQHAEGYEYSEKVYHVTVEPVDNGNGTMTCKITYYDSDTALAENAVPQFVNYYNASGQLKLRAWKTIDGGELKGRTFRFQLYDDEMKPLGVPVQYDNVNGIIDFQLDYTQADIGKTNIYYAREVNDARYPEIVYDKGIICYVVTVIDNGDGTLSFNQSSYRFETPCETCEGTGILNLVGCPDCKATGIELPPLGEAWQPPEISDVPLFTNGLVDGWLSIKKEVESSVADDKIPDDTFTFHVRLIGDKVGDIEKLWYGDGDTDYVDVIDGEFECKLKAGQTLSFRNIPAGTVYQITETDLPEGWDLELDNTKTNGTSGTIPANDKAEAQFTNSYAPDQTAAVIVGAKYLDNKPSHQDAKGNAFKFALEEINANGDPIPNTKQIVEAQPGGLIRFSVGPFTLEGDEEEKVYRYRIYETDCTNQDISYDTHEEIVTVKVAKNANGILYTTVTYAGDENDTDKQIRFNNVTIPGSLELSKTGQGMTEQMTSPLFYYKVRFYNANGIPVSGENIQWYVRDNQTGEMVTEPATAPPTTEPPTTETETEPQDATEAPEPEIAEQNGVHGIAMNDTPLAAANDYVYGDVSGTIVWKIDTTGKLTVSPLPGNESGTLTQIKIPEINEYRAPWYYSQSYITSIYIEPGVKTTSCSSLFRDLTNLVTADLSNLDISGAGSLQYMFHNEPKLTTLNVTGWNTSTVTNLREAIRDCKSLTTIIGIDTWDTSNVKDMYLLFYNCPLMKDFSFLKSWDVSNVTNMGYLLNSCGGVEEIDISGWNMGKVTSTSNMFSSCGNLRTLKMDDCIAPSSMSTLQTMISNASNLKYLSMKNLDATAWTSMYCFLYNKLSKLEELDISGLKSGNVTDWDSAFRKLLSLKKINITGMDTHSATNLRYLFGENTVLEEIIGIEELVTDKAKNVGYMFIDCPAIKSLNLATNGNIWNVENVTDMTNMFCRTSSLEELNVLGWNTVKVTSGSANMVWDAKKIKKITLDKGFYAGSVQNFYDPPSNDIYSGYWIPESEVNEIDQHRYTAEELKEALLNGKAQAGTYVWQQASYLVHFEQGEGIVSGSMVDMLAPIGDPFVIPNNYTRFGYRIAGWQVKGTETVYPDANSTDGIPVIPANTYTSGTEITLVAIWEPIPDNEGLIVYVDYYWEIPGEKGQYELFQSVPYKTEYGLTITIEPEERTGLVLREGSETTATFEVTPESIKACTGADGKPRIAKFYYDHIEYWIHFEGNGADYGSMEDLHMYGGIDKVLGNGFSKTASAFLGWNTEPNGDGITYNDMIPVSIPTEDKAVITLYAIWDTIDQSLTPSAGEITVYCRAGQTIVIPDLPAGTTYEITEINIPDGWTQVSGDVTNQSISAGQTDKVKVINLYSASGAATVTLHKELVGAALTSGAFAFELSANPEFSETLTTELTYDSTDGTSADIRIPGANRIKAELTAYTITGGGTVTVYDEDDKQWGTLNGGDSTEQDSSKTIDVSGDTIRFAPDHNVMQFIYQATVTAYFDKPLQAANSMLDGSEEYYDENGVLIKNDWYGTAPIVFDGLTFTKPGDYTYYIHEVIPDKDDPDSGYSDAIDYDDSVKKVTIRVTDNGNGRLDTEVIYEDSPDGQLFSNVLKKGSLEVTKVLERAAGAAYDKEFAFTVYITDVTGMPLNGKYPYVKQCRNTTVPDEPEAPDAETDDTSGEASTEAQTNDTSGEAPTEAQTETQFETETGMLIFVDGYAQFTLRAEETITIEELPHKAEYYVTEQETEQFEKIGSENEDGTIIGDETQKVTFTNTYLAAGTVVLEFRKNFVGGELEDGMFQFVLRENAENGDVLQTVYADSDGTVKFVLDYTPEQADRIFTYYVQELADASNTDIIYDTHLVKVTVYVTQDPETFALSVRAEYEAGADCTFTNLALYALSVSKEVAGMFGDRMQEFNFTLELTEGELGLPEEIVWSKGDEQGTIKVEPGATKLTHEFKLRHGETITFSGLPYGTKYTITEASYENYETSVTTGTAPVSGSVVNGVLERSTLAAYENYCTLMAELPGAGWFGGTKWLYQLGTAVLLSGLLQAALYVRRRRRNTKTL